MKETKHKAMSNATTVEQIHEVKLIVHSKGRSVLTPNQINQLLAENLKWIEQFSVRQIKIEEVYRQDRDAEGNTVPHKG